jgi:hypothetical protein
VPLVPLGTGSYKRSDGLVPEVVLRNFYIEKDKSGISPDQTLRIQRPGLTRIYDYGTLLRGVHYRTATGERLVVAGGTLYSSLTSKGSIPGSGPVAMVSTPFASLIASAGKAYLYTTSVAALTLPNDGSLRATRTRHSSEHLAATSNAAASTVTRCGGSTTRWCGSATTIKSIAPRRCLRSSAIPASRSASARPPATARHGRSGWTATASTC